MFHLTNSEHQFARNFVNKSLSYRTNVVTIASERKFTVWKKIKPPNPPMKMFVVVVVVVVV